MGQKVSLLIITLIWNFNSPVFCLQVVSADGRCCQSLWLYQEWLFVGWMPTWRKLNMRNIMKDHHSSNMNICTSGQRYVLLRALHKMGGGLREELKLMKNYGGTIIFLAKFPFENIPYIYLNTIYRYCIALYIIWFIAILFMHLLLSISWENRKIKFPPF